MESEKSESQVPNEVSGVSEKKPSRWRPFLTTVGIIVLLLCLCLGVLTLLGPAIGTTMNNIMGVPNGAPE